MMSVSSNDNMLPHVLPADVKMVVIKEEGPDEWNPDGDQQDAEFLHIKYEEEELDVKAETDAIYSSDPTVSEDEGAHMRIHTGERGFIYDLQDQRFSHPPLPVQPPPTKLVEDPPFLFHKTQRAARANGKGKSHMKCCIAGCKEQNKSLHILPTTKTFRRTAWLHFIFDGDIPATISKTLAVCANHFEADCFVNLGQYRAGLASKLLLTERAVPTLHGKSAEGDATTSLQFQAKIEIGCQTEPPEIKKRNVGTQLSLHTLQSHVRSKGVQAIMSTKDCGSGTHDVPLTAPLPCPTPRKRPHLEEEEEVEGSALIVASKGLDATDDSADSANGLTASTDISIHRDGASNPVHHVKNYLVHETSIIELFKVCPVCKHSCSVQTRQIETFISVVQHCPLCDYYRTWDSQPPQDAHQDPGNVLVCGKLETHLGPGLYGSSSTHGGNPESTHLSSDSEHSEEEQSYVSLFIREEAI